MDTEQESLKNKFSKILLGFIVGVASTLLLLLLLILLIVNVTSNSKKQTITSENILKLNLTYPDENLATSDKTVTISGSTGITSIVTISCGKQSKIVAANGGHFSASLDLNEGKNVVTITAFDPNTGDSQQTSREVLYLNEDLTNL